MNFKFTTAGESHGKALVAVVEGLPAGLPVDAEQINRELRRRQQGYGRGGRMKIETDRVEFLSGVRHGRALGSPVALMIENRDFVHWTEIMSAEMPENEPKNPRLVKRPRPGHADLAGGQKFAARDLRDILERASARETPAVRSPNNCSTNSEPASKATSSNWAASPTRLSRKHGKRSARFRPIRN